MSIDAVVLSHLHADHCLDLCGLYVMKKYRPPDASRTPIPVYGPRRTDVRMARAYDLAPPDGMESEFDFRTLVDGEAVTIGPFTLTPLLVNHPVEAYGMRVEADGVVLAYTGDTDTCDALKSLCHNATMVLADSAFVDGRDEARGVHMSGSRAAQAALDAGGVRRLMLTHLPPWNDPSLCRSQAGAVWPGEVELAEADAVHEL
jgi:ribonuclease BN (tRNA processing enzyme)